MILIEAKFVDYKCLPMKSPSASINEEKTRGVSVRLRAASAETQRTQALTVFNWDPRFIRARISMNACPEKRRREGPTGEFPGLSRTAYKADNADNVIHVPHAYYNMVSRSRPAVPVHESSLSFPLISAWHVSARHMPGILAAKFQHDLALPHSG